MAPKRMTKVEKAQWLRLYEMADRMDRLAPWQWMGVADCFGVEVPGLDEPCFVVFNGNEERVRSVRFLLGWKAFYDFVTRLADPTRQGPAWLLEIRMIELLYVEDAMLFEHESRLLKTLNRPFGEGVCTPVFRSIIPGFHPWAPDAQERNWLDLALYQAFGMALRVESEHALLRERFPHEIRIRRPDGQGGWQDTLVPVIEPKDEEVEVRIESARLTKIAAQPLRPVTVQLDLVFTALKILPSGERPQTAYVLLAVDANSGLIYSGELMQATEGVAAMWADVPNRLLALFEHMGGCPSAIEIKGERMANLLRPLGEFLPFKMVRRERLTVLEEVRESLVKTLRRQAEDETSSA